MALGATIYRLVLNVSDVDRGYYGEHTLRVARHPSETEERMMVRILAFARHASASLALGGDLSGDEGADLIEKADDGDLLHAICIGTPDPKWLRKAAGRARQVSCYAYGNSVPIWWRRSQEDLERLPRLAVIGLDPQASRDLAGLAARTMQLQATIQDDLVWMDDGSRSVELAFTTIKARAEGPMGR